MNKQFLRKATLFYIISFQACASPTEETFTCPEKIHLKASVSDTIPGWEVQSIAADHFLISTTFSDGHPSQMGYLRPSRTIGKNESIMGIESAIYDLSDMMSGEAWLVCQYANTSAILTKQLSKLYSKCEVSLPKDISEQKVVCKS